MIDHIYVIAHPEYEKDRIQYIKNYFNNNPIDISLTFYKPFWKTDDIFLNHYCDSLKKSEKCLTETYIKLFEYILKNTNDNNILILESDVIFCKDFNIKLTKIIKEFKNLNIENSLIFLGNGCWKNKKLDNQVSENIFEQNGTRCTDSMFFTRLTIQKFYYKMKDLYINKPVDHLWNDFIEETNTRFFWLQNPIIEQGSIIGLYTSNIK